MGEICNNLIVLFVQLIAAARWVVAAPATAAGGTQLIDPAQLLLGLSDLELGLLHLQTLPLQLQLRQGRVVGHEYVALFHMGTHLHRYAGDDLGIA